jgi:hypothetical protein
MKFNEVVHRLKQKYIDQKINRDVHDLRILLLNAPCNGFGDIVFAMKLASYIKKWYDITPMIASTQTHYFLDLGEKEENMIRMTTSKNTQCRRFARLTLPDNLPTFDVILVAPMQADYGPDIKDVQAILPYANTLNTLFFSEYNDDLGKGFDFNMGLGNGRDGMLLDSFVKEAPIETIENMRLKPGTYAVIYIANLDTSYKCMNMFIEMVVKKYSHLPLFEIVLPNWVNIDAKLVDKLKPYFSQITVETKPKITVYYRSLPEKNLLTFRQDIFPLKYKDMSALYKYSVRDILLTGDQSISDVIGCCWEDKLPFYQVVPWKKDFSKKLAQLLPQKFIKSSRTACGSLDAIHYQPDFKKFVETQNFSNHGKIKLDALLSLIHKYKNE